MELWPERCLASSADGETEDTGEGSGLLILVPRSRGLHAVPYTWKLKKKKKKGIDKLFFNMISTVCGEN